MSRILSADYIFTGKEVIADAAIVIDDADRIEDVVSRHETPGDVQHFRGYLLPGFINTHCHLELSHMKGLIPTGTGLVDFIKDVVTKRDATAEAIEAATRAADAEMWAAGVQAVGDISNTTDSFAAKRDSQLAYYTFVEAFDLMQSADTANCLANCDRVLAEAPDSKSIVPHAPYSCSIALLQAINQRNTSALHTVSIHNQETIAEAQFFENKSGALIDFYTGFGLDLSTFDATGQPSINYLMEHMDAAQRYLLVHNTMTSPADIRAAKSKWPQLYWTTCANANLYIENQLPDYRTFVEEGAIMTIGTDSLASNWQLSVWDELLTIKKYNSYLSNIDLLTWATSNGAAALQFSELGSIAVGQKPGILHINTSDRIEDLIHTNNRPVRII